MEQHSEPNSQCVGIEDVAGLTVAFTIAVAIMLCCSTLFPDPNVMDQNKINKSDTKIVSDTVP